MLNEVKLIGRLGADPELKHLSKGNTVCRFSIATSVQWTDKEGNKQENTEWTNVVAWGKLGEVCAQYLYKGSIAYVSGRLQTRSWEKDGQKKYATEVIANDVIFLNFKKKPENESQPDFDPEDMPF